MTITTATDSPVTATGDTITGVKLPAAPLAAAIQFAGTALGRNVSIPMLTYLHMTIGPAPHVTATGEIANVSGLTFVATDRYRLMWATVVLPDMPKRHQDWGNVSGADLAAESKRWPKSPRLGPDYVRLSLIGDVFDVGTHATGATLQVQPDTFPTWRDLVGRQDGAELGNYLHLSPVYMGSVCTAFAKLDRSQGVGMSCPAIGKAVRFGRMTAHEVSGHQVWASAMVMPIRLPR